MLDEARFLDGPEGAVGFGAPGDGALLDAYSTAVTDAVARATPAESGHAHQHQAVRSMPAALAPRQS